MDDEGRIPVREEAIEVVNTLAQVLGTVLAGAQTALVEGEPQTGLEMRLSIDFAEAGINEADVIVGLGVLAEYLLSSRYEGEEEEQ